MCSEAPQALRHSTGYISTVAQFWRLVEDLAARRDKLFVGCIQLILAEKRHAVAVLEGQLHPKMGLKRAAHRIPGQPPQQLPTHLFNCWRHLILDTTVVL